MNEGLADRLFLLKYAIDDDSHLVLRDPTKCADCQRPCINRCPAEVYSWEEDKLQIAYENCLECGVCKIVCEKDNLEWRYPRGGFGVFYKFG
jgi:ferredoxin like protein